MNKKNIAKGIVGTVASVGVGAVVGNAIKSTTPVDITTINKVMVGAGAFVLTSLVGDVASKYTGAKIDEITEQFNQNMQNPNKD